MDDTKTKRNAERSGTKELQKYWYSPAWWALHGSFSDVFDVETAMSAFCILFLLPFDVRKKTRSGRSHVEEYADPEHIGRVRDALRESCDRIAECPVEDVKMRAERTRKMTACLLSGYSGQDQNRLRKNDHYEAQYGFLCSFYPPPEKHTDEAAQRSMYDSTVRYFREVIRKLFCTEDDLRVLVRRIRKIRGNDTEHSPSNLTRSAAPADGSPADTMARLLFDILLKEAFDKSVECSSGKQAEYWENRKRRAFDADADQMPEADQMPAADQTPAAGRIPFPIPAAPPQPGQVSVPAKLLATVLRRLDADAMTAEEIGLVAEFLGTPEGREWKKDAPVAAMTDAIRRQYKELTIRAADIEDQTAAEELSVCRRIYGMLKGLGADG